MEFCRCGNELGFSTVKVTRYPCRCETPLSKHKREAPNLDPLHHVSEKQFNERRRLGLDIMSPLEKHAYGKHC